MSDDDKLNLNNSETIFPKKKLSKLVHFGYVPKKLPFDRFKHE